MRLSNLSLTFLPTPNGRSGRPGTGRRSSFAPPMAAAAPGLLPRLLGPGENGRGDGSQSALGVSNEDPAIARSPAQHFLDLRANLSPGGVRSCELINLR